MTIVMDARGLHKRYSLGDTHVDALRGVELLVSEGEFVAIMGPSGSGKTTLLKLLAGLETPSQGSVRLSDRRFSEMDDNARTELRRGSIGVIFQFFNLLPSLTAAENVALPLMLAGHGMAECQGRAREALESVGLDDRRNHLPDQLSGGEQQRTAVARAMIASPSVLLADEPTGNLDHRAGEGVLQLLLHASSDHHQAIVLVTHDPLAASFADRVLFLRDGRFVDELRGPRPPVGDIVQRLGSLEES